MKTCFEKHSDFLLKTREFLNTEVTRGVVSSFTCNINSKLDYASGILNGKVHTKAPQQNTRMTSASVQMRLSNGRSAAFHFIGSDFSQFVREYENTKHVAMSLEHNPRIIKHAAYPELALSSPELIALFETNTALSRLEDLTKHLDSFAANVKHPNLMGREVSASISISRRSYFDSVLNFAEEDSASCYLAATFSLIDSSEYSSDIFGVLPTAQDCKNVVDEAAKNLLKTDVRTLTATGKVGVLLTHKAVVTLVSDLILPNLSTRSILDGTGAWEKSHLGKKVLQNITLRDDPHLKFSPFSSAFDVEGTPSQTVTIMEGGKLKHPLFTSLLLEELKAEDAKLASQFALTGHADSSTSASPTNLFIEIEAGEVPSSNDLLRLADTVIVVNWLTGMSVDPLTGQFALDSEGAKVYERGTLAFSTSLTLRGNFFEALADPNNKRGPMERFYNYFAPSLFTTSLSCVSKEMGAS